MSFKSYKQLLGTGLVWITMGFVSISALALCWVIWGWAVLISAEYRGRAVERSMDYNGRGILAEATSARQARIEQAKAEEAAAEATANAIRIVGEAAQKYPEYRQQEFYLSLGEALKDGNISQIIYIPTEAGMPITEASRFEPSIEESK